MEEIVGARVRRVPARELGHNRVDNADMYLSRQGAEGGGMSGFLKRAKALTTQARGTASAELLARAKVELTIRTAAGTAPTR